MRSKLAVAFLCLAACSQERRAPDGFEPMAGADAEANDYACTVTELHSGPNAAPEKHTWTYDPATRRLVTTTYAYDLDEQGRTVNTYGIERGTLTRYWANSYDEHGNRNGFEHYTSGRYDYVNTYDAEGRLVSVDSAGPDLPPSRTTYQYGNPSTPRVWTLSEDVNIDGSINDKVERMIADERTSVVRTSVQGHPYSEFAFNWSGDQIDAIERDGGGAPGNSPVGKPNMRFEWLRDPQGNVIEFTQDGTDAFDHSAIDGAPDYEQNFSAGCAPLLKQFPWLAHEPAPNSTGPRFRDDGV